MKRTWTFTDIEFFSAWDRTQKDLLPYPFTYVSTIEFADDHQREMLRAWERLRDRWGMDLDDLLADIGRPDIRIEVSGSGGGLPDRLRMVAARREDRGYLIRQRPEGFTVTEHTAVGLAEAVVAALPESAAGRHEAITLVNQKSSEDIDFYHGMSRVQDSPEGTVAGQSEWFLNAPTSGTGTVVVVQGWSRFGPRGVARRTLTWRDLTDDGRYVVRPGKPSTATGADAQRFVALLNTEIVNVVRTIKDERA
ncbi:ESX secretion-associated protein EspG [Nocardia lijiangensis]|uniref:ESX secretion-associated protein EspG n=1 Tax=Nocardia lijiangensis TaxID=299618 RepID=UPI003D757507